MFSLYSLIQERKWQTFLLPVEDNALEKGLKQPLLISSEDKGDEDADDDSEEALEESRQPANSIGSAYRLLTPSVKVCKLSMLHYQSIRWWTPSPTPNNVSSQCYGKLYFFVTPLKSDRVCPALLKG